MSAIPTPTEPERIALAVAFAQELALAGFGIVEAYPPTATGCGCPKGDACPSPGKHPVGEEWPKRATRSPQTIAQLVTRRAGQYGVIPWPGEGRMILDIDHADALPVPLPASLRVTRGAERGHVYLALPPTYDAASLPATAAWGEVRVAGAARHVIGPWSRHASGDIYVPHGTPADINEILAVVLAQLFPPAQAVIGWNGQGYHLPEAGYRGSRYDAIRDYVAHLWGKRIRDRAEVLASVLGVLAPLFSEALSSEEISSRFERTWDGIASRLAADAEPARAEPAPEPRSPVGESVGRVDMIDAADLLALDLPPLKWIVPDLIPEGTTVIASPPKVGKSCFVYQVVTEVALGGELLGRRVASGSALYLALEDGKRRGQDRLRAALAGRTMPHGRLDVQWGARKIGEGLEEDIAAWLGAHADAAVVAIDTLGKVRPASSGRRNQYEVDVEDLGRLQNLFRDLPISLLIVHHARKDSGGDDFLQAVSGTYGLTGSVDTIAALRRKRLETFGTLVVTGRDVPDAELSVRFDGTLWHLAPASLPAASFERMEVYRVIEQEGPIFPQAIANRLNLERSSVQHMVDKLVEGGAVARTTSGYAAASVDLTLARAHTGVPDHSDHSDSDHRDRGYLRAPAQETTSDPMLQAVLDATGGELLPEVDQVGPSYNDRAAALQEELFGAPVEGRLP